MIYRRILPVASGVAVFAGGIFSFNKLGSKMPFTSKSNDQGLKNYTFVDSKKFELVNVCILTKYGARTPNYFIHSKFAMPDWCNETGCAELSADLNYPVDIKELPNLHFVDEESVQDEYLRYLNKKSVYGQLTSFGQVQSINFGKELKRIYIKSLKFLKEDFNDSEILCRSTKFPRTFYTLKGVLSGLYGAENFNLCRKPTIYTMPISQELMYPNMQLCPVIGNFVSTGSVEISKDSEIIKMKCLLKTLLGVEKLSFVGPDIGKTKRRRCEKHRDKNDGNDIGENVTIYAVRDDFVSRDVHSFEIPSAFPTLYPEIDRFASQEILYEYLGGSQEWEDRIPILISPLLNFMKTNMKSAVTDFLVKPNCKKNPCVPNMKDALMKKKSKMKMQILSCHDSTYIPLLTALRIYDGRWPIFMSSLIVELYKEKSTDNFFVRVLYNGLVQDMKLNEKSCENPSDYNRVGLHPFTDFLLFLDTYSFPDEFYTSSCDKALKLVSSGKPVIKEHYSN